MKKFLSKALRYLLRFIDKDAVIDELRVRAKENDNDIDDIIVDVIDLKLKADSRNIASEEAKSIGNQATDKLIKYTDELKRAGVNRLMDKLL